MTLAYRAIVLNGDVLVATHHNVWGGFLHLHAHSVDASRNALEHRHALLFDFDYLFILHGRFHQVLVTAILRVAKHSRNHRMCASVLKHNNLLPHEDLRLAPEPLNSVLVEECNFELPCSKVLDTHNLLDLETLHEILANVNNVDTLGTRPKKVFGLTREGAAIAIIVPRGGRVRIKLANQARPES
ncbi:hypothetical protein MRX96_051004 [Rhipicephalus microplus]